MTWIQTVVLAVVQGLTEFLPISSSGHLVLVPAFAGWTDQGLAFDIAVHFGSLIAVCIYFRRDVAAMIVGAVDVLQGNLSPPGARLAFGIGLATIPAAIAGLLFADWIEANLRSPSVVVFTLAGFGILMALADRLGRRVRKLESLGWQEALLIGVSQALALIPGTSRSGITITTGLALGLERPDAARFSFLLSVPVILLATANKGLSIVMSGEAVDWGMLSLGVAVTAVVAYLSIEFFMRFVNTIGLWPFAVYRLLLAGVIVYVLL